MSFAPKLSVLPEAQRKLWPELAQVPGHFVLYGGTAVALHYGHRASVDFDFFTSEPVNPDELMRSLPFLRGGKPVQVAANTLDVRGDARRGDKNPVSRRAVLSPGARSAGNRRQSRAGGVAAGFARDETADDLDAQPGEGFFGH